MKWKQRVRHIKRKMKDSSATDHIMNAIFFKRMLNCNQSLIVGFKKQKYTTDCISCHLICLIMKLFGKKIATYSAKHVSKEILILFFRKLSY